MSDRLDLSGNPMMDFSLQGLPDNAQQWAMDGPNGGPVSSAPLQEFLLPEDHEASFPYLADTASPSQGSFPAFYSAQSTACLPVSSGCSDMTDSSVCTSAGSRFALMPFPDPGFVAPIGALHCPEAQARSAMEDGDYTYGQSWDTSLMTSSSRPLPFALTSSSDGFHAGGSSRFSDPITGPSLAVATGANCVVNNTVTAPESDLTMGFVPGLLEVVPNHPGQSAHSGPTSSGYHWEKEDSNLSNSEESPSPRLQFDIDEDLFRFSPTGNLTGRRTSDETDWSIARSHPLYQAQPKEDGLYHCPFEGEEGCNHKPENLKCNYHKHIDSHLRPYRCKIVSCSKQRFSSTACLLRHEREAHGMHGHGEKPYACPFDDCDRSERGFPRKWNLADHMRRVHPCPAQPGSNSTSSTLVASSINGRAESQPASKKKAAAASKKSKPRRNSKTMTTNGIRTTGTTTGSIQPAASLPELSRFGPDNDLADGYFQDGAQMMQATRSMNGMDQLHSHSAHFEEYDIGALRLHSAYDNTQMDPNNVGHPINGTGLHWPH